MTRLALMINCIAFFVDIVFIIGNIPKDWRNAFFGLLVSLFLGFTIAGLALSLN